MVGTPFSVSCEACSVCSAYVSGRVAAMSGEAALPAWESAVSRSTSGTPYAVSIGASAVRVVRPPSAIAAASNWPLSRTVPVDASMSSMVIVPAFGR